MGAGHVARAHYIVMRTRTSLGAGVGRDHIPGQANRGPCRSTRDPEKPGTAQTVEGNGQGQQHSGGHRQAAPCPYPTPSGSATSHPEGHSLLPAHSPLSEGLLALGKAPRPLDGMSGGSWKQALVPGEGEGLASHAAQSPVAYRWKMGKLRPETDSCWWSAGGTPPSRVEGDVLGP